MVSKSNLVVPSFTNELPSEPKEDVKAKEVIKKINNQDVTNLNKSIDLPLGNYSDPLIFSYNKRKKFSIFDNQSKKIYLFDDKLNLVESFPLYSISNIDLDNIDKDQNLELILAEDESSIRLYEINN